MQHQQQLYQSLPITEEEFSSLDASTNEALEEHIAGHTVQEWRKESG